MNKSVLFLSAMVLLSACRSDIGANDYTTGSVGRASSAYECSVVSVRQVNVKSNNGVGTLAGGAAGAIGGYAIGGDKTAHLLGGVGGAVLGGMLGNAAQNALSSQSGYEYIVKLNNGRLETITQGTDVLLSPGQKCLLLMGNPNRLIGY